MEHMHCLYVDFDIKEVKPNEYIRLEEENKLLKKQNEETNKRIDDLEKIVLGGMSDGEKRELHNLL